MSEQSAENDERCPNDGQTVEWHRVVGGTHYDGSPRTNGEFIGCDFGIVPPPADNRLPVDVAVGRALSATVAEHIMGTETSGGVYDMGHGMFGAYHWCACGWRSDDGPWRDPATYVRGMAQAKIDHLANALNAAVREHVNRAQAEVANSFVGWAAQNEIAEPPLDWAWFGEITRRYSPLHEEHETRVTPPEVEQP